MKRATISWSHKARIDLLEMGDFIARDKHGAVSRWVDRIIAAVEGTAIFPSSGRIVPEVDREDIREIILDHYRIVYQTRGDEIIVLTVFEGHRLLSDLVIERNKVD